MARIQFKTTNMTEATLERIDQANSIIEEYMSAGYRMTLRQLYYQFVSRDLFANVNKNYRMLGTTVMNGRLAGLIDWDAIEDRGRVPDMPSQWESLDALLKTAIKQFRLPRWKTQPTYAELWVEKQALAGVLAPLAYEFHVPLMVNKGYSSQSAMFESSQRFRRAPHHDKPKHLFYLGDLDPSGEDMVRDIRERLHMFGVDDLEVTKVALTMAQVEEHEPPPNPTKITDPRAQAFIDEFGESCWEVDALPPPTLEALIREAFEEIIDEEAMTDVEEAEDAQRHIAREDLGWDGDDDE